MVSFGDLLRPNFSVNGELVGFEIRSELIPVMHIGNGLEAVTLRRAIRACSYMNRILLDGRETDFALKVIEKGEEADEIDVGRQYFEAEVQVDTESLNANAHVATATEESEVESEEVEELGTPRSMLVNIIKDHLVTLISYNDNQKKAYYNMIMGSYSLDKLMAYQIEGLHSNKLDVQRNQKISFEKYLK